MTTWLFRQDIARSGRFYTITWKSTQWGSGTSSRLHKTVRERMASEAQNQILEMLKHLSVQAHIPSIRGWFFLPFSEKMYQT